MMALAILVACVVGFCVGRIYQIYKDAIANESSLTGTPYDHWSTK